MRHLKAKRKFSRTPAHRRALFRSLATGLLRDEQIETTLEKAKDLRSVVEKLITKARTGSLHARRQAYSYLMSKAVVHKLFVEIAPRFSGRSGGYTRVLKTGIRHGDAAQMAVISLVEEKASPAKAKETKKRAPRKKMEAAIEQAAQAE